nr:MAG TPA: hypothetical protein [Caudoviricetes sp.]
MGEIPLNRNGAYPWSEGNDIVFSLQKCKGVFCKPQICSEYL